MSERTKVKVGVVVSFLGAVALATLLSVACVNSSNVANASAGVDSHNGSGGTEVGGACALGSVQPGTVGDERRIRPGGTLGIGVVLIGKQGVALPDNCQSLFTPTWTSVSGPCTFSANYDGIASAPASATLGAECVADVKVEEKHGTLRLVISASGPASSAPGAKVSFTFIDR